MYKCVCSYEEQSEGEYQIELERITRLTSLEDKMFAPDCEVETERADGDNTMEVRLVYTPVGPSCLGGMMFDL